MFTALGLHCCAQALSSCVSMGFSLQWLSLLQSTALGAQASVVVACNYSGSLVAVNGLSCSTACEIFPDQGSHLALHWHVDS